MNARERIAIVGSRKWPTERLLEVEDYVAFLPQDIVLISGGAAGVDRMAEEAARGLGMEVSIYLPDYERYGPDAPLRRNMDIALTCTRMVVFWDGSSKGSMHAAGLARSFKKSVEVFR